MKNQYAYLKEREVKVLDTLGHSKTALTPTQIADKTGLKIETVIATLIMLDVKNKVWSVGGAGDFLKKKYMKIEKNPKGRKMRKTRTNKASKRYRRVRRNAFQDRTPSQIEKVTFEFARLVKLYPNWSRESRVQEIAAKFRMSIPIVRDIVSSMTHFGENPRRRRRNSGIPRTPEEIKRHLGLNRYKVWFEGSPSTEKMIYAKSKQSAKQKFWFQWKHPFQSGKTMVKEVK